MKGNLYNRIISEGNIYSAIYSIESYITEKEILSENDLDLLFDLSDKFDEKKICRVIDKCKKKLEMILSSESDYFNIQVYFKLKGGSPSELNFRPIHTADVCSQICMVSILNVLMFDDECQSNGSSYKYTRKFSGLSRLIPSNFFGNIPSLHIERLFCNWGRMYGEYSESVLKKFDYYRKNGVFKYEICLDIKEYFPNVDPEKMFQYIVDKLTPGKSEDDILCLKMAVSKLLFFRLDNIEEEWMMEYYGSNDIGGKVSRGLPQGLPQSLFFGNLFMVEIARCINDSVQGDSLFYVDDSVIFTNTHDPDIRLIENKIDEILWSNETIPIPIDQEYKTEASKIYYKILFHEFGDKSSSSDLSEPNSDILALRPLTGLTYNINNALYLSVDEKDDSSTNMKLQSVVQLVDSKLKNSDFDKSAGKKLVQYKKFFTYRLNLLEERAVGKKNDDGPSVRDSLSDILNSDGKDENKNIHFLEIYEEEAFYPNLKYIIRDKMRVPSEIENFERSLTGKNQALYIGRYAKGVSRVCDKKLKSYSSLSNEAASKYRNVEKLAEVEELSKLKSVLEEKPDDTKYKSIVVSSDNYKRQILNSKISRIINVSITDDYCFFKKDNRTLRYYELRLLLWLRNRSFCYEKFLPFATDLIKNAEMGDGCEIVDYKLLEILYIFVGKVRNPAKVDSLILVHKLVNGLWKNGSRFLHFYTLHNEEHSIELVKNVVTIVNSIDALSIKKVDFYIIFLSCYLHDISMVIHPDLNQFVRSETESDEIFSRFMEESIMGKDNVAASDVEVKSILLKYFRILSDYFESDIRQNHTKNSAALIRKWSRTEYLKFIDEAVLEVVAEISESHGYDCDEVYGRKSFAGKSIYSVKYMMILIRLADLLDMTKDRVSYYLLKENIKHMSSTSRFHWISHLITDRCQFNVKYEPVLNSEKDQYIVETLQFDLYLNIKNLTKIKPRECQFMKCCIDQSENRLVIDVADSISKCESECTLMCGLVTQKHEYLFQELFVLQRYLKKINREIFKTKIKVVVHFENKRDLDAEFNDAAIEYMNKHC